MKHGFITFFPPPNISIAHVYVGCTLAIICFFIYYKVCTVKPGIINPRSVRQALNKFDYDGIIFKEGEICKTCKLKKYNTSWSISCHWKLIFTHLFRPARSKHCRICDVCVSRFDHHCVWYLKLEMSQALTIH